MQRYYIIEGLFILLGIGLLVTVIKYPKDIFVKLPLGIVNLFLRRLWWFVSLPLTILSIPLIALGKKFKWEITPAIQKFIDFEIGGEEDSPYPSTKNLKVDFKNCSALRTWKRYSKLNSNLGITCELRKFYWSSQWSLRHISKSYESDA